MLISRSVLPAAVALLATAAFSRADVLFNDFGPSDTYSSTGGITASILTNAGTRFVLPAPATPTHITVAMKAASNTTITLSICSETNNHPGTTLFSTTVDVTAGDPQVYQATFAAPSELSASTNYWVKAVPASGFTSAVWMPNSIGRTGEFAGQTGTGTWVFMSGGVTPALRLESDSAPTGACCTGSICVSATAAACTGLYSGDNAACNPAGNSVTPCCKADFNQSSSVTVQDIFDFLSAWFASDPRADINGAGTSVQDIFDFLSAWFTGC